MVEVIESHMISEKHQCYASTANRAMLMLESFPCSVGKILLTPSQFLIVSPQETQLAEVP